MRIIELDENQNTHRNTEITVAGVVRATYTKPFSYFLLEDASATLICRPNGSLPWPGAHIEITGCFVLETPEHCTVQLAILKEQNRAYIVHHTYTCELASCEFANLPDAAKLNLMWA
jgi:hypothetical protein